MIKRIYSILFIYSFGIIFLSESVSAYVNPGSGSAIAGTLWPLIVIALSTTGAFIIKHFWNPIKRLFFKCGDNKKEKKD